MNLLGKILGSRYEIIEEAGIGGMATVYKAKCNLLNRFVAVKVLKEEFSKNEEFVKRFRAEAQSAASLTHPNIVSVYDVGEENGINYIVMEYLKGNTLKDLIEKEGKLSNELTLKFASQIASALEAAHSSKIIHRDIKPQNIVLVNNNTIAKVTDFGIAKMSSKDTITSSASTIGSVHYFSPEHAKGCYTDEKSDIYSLGVVMYEMVTGKLPFNAESPVTVALKQIQEIPIPPKEIMPTVSKMLNNIIMKAMEKNTSSRYQKATELLDDIFAAINSPDNELMEKKHEYRHANTQVVPIIGLKDDIRPSIADEIPSEIIESRKALRTGKKISDIEKQKTVDQNKPNIKTKKKKTIIWSIVGISVIIIGILVGSLAMTINRKNKKEPIYTVVPKLIGENFEEMKSKYKDLGLNITVNKYEENAEVEQGYIIEQSIAEGEKITDNTISVIVSKGIKKVTMIDTINKDYTVVKYELESIGLIPEFEFVESDEIKKNIIIAQDVKKDEEVAYGTTIKIKVSKGNGKILVIIPSVIGVKESNAKETLEARKLKVSVTYANDSSKADGMVLTQSLKENQEVEEGTIIELSVNRLEKTKTVTIPLSTLTATLIDETVNVKVTAQVEGVTNIIHNDVHTKQNDIFEDFTVDVNGFTSAKITIYINGENKEQKTISF